MRTFTNLTKESQSSIFSLPDRKILFERIKSITRSFSLYKESGLGMMKIIDDIFKEQGYGSYLSPYQIKKFNRGLMEIRKTSMSTDYINSQLSRKLPNGIGSVKLVLDNDGEWHHVNKLNTNYLDISDLLTELVMRGIERNPEKGMSIYDSIIKNPKEGLLSIKPYLKQLIIFYFIKNGLGIDDFKSFTKYSIKMSKIGEDAEQEVSDYLKSMGFEIKYSGGNGDFIDMIFGCDLIVSREDIGYKSVQVKSIIHDWKKLSHYKVDWVAETGPTRIYNLRHRTLAYL
jgi:hypothetical protein